MLLRMLLGMLWGCYGDAAEYVAGYVDSDKREVASSNSTQRVLSRFMKGLKSPVKRDDSAKYWIVGKGSASSAAKH